MDRNTRPDASSYYASSVPEDAFDSRSSRRAFLRTASASAILAVMGLPITGCGDENPVGAEEPGPGEEENGETDSGITIEDNEIILDLTKEDTEVLTAEGGFLLIGTADTMAVNVNGEAIRAFTSICTHQQCTINQFDGDTFNCPCHGSQYNTSGEVVQGPAPEPLTEYDVERSGDTVTITR